jgi:predicted small secreted protein
MKKSPLLCAALVAASTLASANAQTVINITGATAFRQAAHQAILDSFDAGSVTYGYQSTNVGNAGRAMFKGTINSGADQVVVRTSWSGAVAGVRAIVNQSNAVTYWAATTATYNLLTSGGASGLNPGTESVTTGNKIAFSDNAHENTPFDGSVLSGGPVGVIAFVPVTNNSTHISSNGSTNITQLQLRRLMQAGKAPLQFVTGNSSHSGKKIYWTGRQDTSGTRAIYLSEMGVGASTAVQQYRVEPLDNTTTTATAVRLWPTGDSTNASTIWGSDTAGNGGYASGGALSPVLQRTSTSIIEKDAGNSTVSSGVDAVLLSVISAQEGQDIQNGGGKVLAYNGVYIEPEALPTGLSETDKDKIRKGAYTLWSYERLYYRNDITDQVELDFITALEGNVATVGNIGGNGVAISEMKVSRSQSSDGGSLTVLNSLN